MDPEVLRGWWSGWPWGNGRRVENELVRSHAAILREQAASLREDASFTRWYSERQREYGRYLCGQLAELRPAAQARPAAWLVPRPDDAPSEPVAVSDAAVPAGEAGELAHSVARGPAGGLTSKRSRERSLTAPLSVALRAIPPCRHPDTESGSSLAVQRRLIPDPHDPLLHQHR